MLRGYSGLNIRGCSGLPKSLLLAEILPFGPFAHIVCSRA